VCSVENGVASRLAESKQIIFRSIFTAAKKLSASLGQIKMQLSTSYEIGFGNIHQLKSLLDDYNNLRKRFLSLVDPNQYALLPIVSTNFLKPPKLVRSYLYADNIDIALSEVIRAERGCHIMISVCEDLMRPEIPPKSIDQLNQLRSEVEKIEKDLPSEETLLADNIRIAIKEYEQGHFLASALIASRVIRYVYEKIPSEQQATKDTSQQKLQTLIKIGAIDKDREDEQKLFLRASVRARDYLSHDAKIFPQVEEALNLISSAVTFCKYFIYLIRSRGKSEE
jgi:hypothetical protein